WLCCLLVGLAAASAAGPRAAAATVLTADAPPVVLGNEIEARFGLAAARAPGGGIEMAFFRPAAFPLFVFTTLKIQHFAGDGTAIGGETEASAAGDRDQLAPAIAPLAGGGFVVAWCSRPAVGFPVDPTALNHGILTGRLLDASGQP